jgi:putative FmdB family regulatory protein
VIRFQVALSFLSAENRVPLFEYECRKCGKRSERIEKFDGPRLQKCPKCGGKVDRLLSAPAIQFKGSGWYVTDYGKSSGASGKESGASEGSKSESKSENKSDAKSESKSEGKTESKAPSSTGDKKKPAAKSR